MPIVLHRRPRALESGLRGAMLGKAVLEEGGLSWKPCHQLGEVEALRRAGQRSGLEASTPGCDTHLAASKHKTLGDSLFLSGVSGIRPTGYV